MKFKDWLTTERYETLLKEARRYIPAADADDVLHEVVLQLLESGNELDDYPSYVARACWRSYKSTTSPYARKYGKGNPTVELDGTEENIPDEVDELASVDVLKMIADTPNLCWWEREAVKRKVIEGKTYKEVAEEWDITPDQAIYSIHTAINNIRNHYNISVMKKNKENEKALFEQQPEQPAEEKQEGIGVSIEYEVNPEKPNTVETVMNAKIEVKKPEPVDPQIAILQAFAAIMKKHGRHGLVKMEIAQELWQLWQKYTGRTDRWRKCSSCVIPKVHRMIKECQKYNIEYL